MLMSDACVKNNSSKLMSESGLKPTGSFPQIGVHTSQSFQVPAYWKCLIQMNTFPSIHYLASSQWQHSQQSGSDILNFLQLFQGGPMVLQGMLGALV